MKQNKYDNELFFSEYKKMSRSVDGLEGAGEWPIFKELLPDFNHKTVLDLGCGFGWHCRYAREQHATQVIGVDLSEKMLKTARNYTNDPLITYLRMPIEDIHFKEEQFDVVISSLAFHYIKDFRNICDKVYQYLKPGGSFIFSVEHPIFTARAEQDWYYDEEGVRLHWPVDHYQSEGMRETLFLTENVVKYHRTLSSYMNDVIQAGFNIKAVKESLATEEMLQDSPEMKDENRRPMFLIMSAEKVNGE
ncbi:class I SAM-dependent methyltransferase [Oceanobacillus luteolus]|uniref:class I SAM-dependent methyltransferase n=1 Tax=Oceanobacillus luteolus TaxID=1274358 RepID=UPI0020404C48|nr:class I SAM-dependent methyltransferase [Oceanobacillus luteolus]MCM3741997.1 class I SAM-dependent methyltransferase [Oceanobacillus luteolus]